MNMDTQSHASEHHKRHWDFAQLLITLSTVFLTIVTASKGLAVNSSWALTCVLIGQLLSLFCGVGLLYQMVKEPAFHQLAQEGSMTKGEAEIEIKTNRQWCEWLHSAQTVLFAVSFLVLVFVLAFA